MSHVAGLDRTGSTPPGEHPPHDAPVIDVRDLRRSYGEAEVLHGLSFSVAPGEVFGLLGPNGAGKSTLISILCSLLRPTSGTASVAGFDVVADPLAVRRRIGLVFQDPTLDQDLTAAENLRFHAEIYGMPRSLIGPRMDEVLEVVDLAARRDGLVRTFSGGMRRRLEIARGLMHAPRVLFLDEPTIGLDPHARYEIWAHIQRLREREGSTIFLTTHYMEEAEHCDRIAIVDDGRLVGEGTPDALKATIGADRIELHVDDPAAAITRIAERFAITATLRDGAVAFSVVGGEALAPRLIAELGMPIRSVRISRPTLDDVFMAFAGRTMRDAEALRSEGHAA
jgi:ABC-2 type transport system ATP-binding protein